MSSTTKWISLAVLLAGVVFVTACERTITYTEETTTPASCFACHSDANTALVAAEGQWANSKHASAENTDRGERSSCSPCHTSEGFVRKANGEPAMGFSNPTAIHCFTCHAPHTNGDLSLRITAPQRLQNGVTYDLRAANICSSCHQARNGVNTYVADDTLTLSDRWGPHHSVQADMVIGTNGYEYSFYDYEVLPYHRAATEDACLDCHFSTTRNYILGGHSFNMAWEAEGGEEEINTEGCNVDACHAGRLESFNYENVQEDVEALIAQLRQLLIDGKLLKYYDEDGVIELLPYDRDVYSRVEPGDSAGAVWNYLMADEDRSHGVHNAWYIKGLLESSIQFMEGGGGASAVSAAAVSDRRTVH